MAERCVVKIVGKGATSFAACFYNEKKVAQGAAKCLAMRNFGELERFFIHDPVMTSRYFQKIADHNSMVKHPQKHIIFSFPGKASKEQVEQLLKDAAATLDRLGYKGQPQIFWLHEDTGNTHIHAASVTVSVRDGRWIDNYMEGRRARRILDQLRGVSYSNDIDRLLDYKFETRQQFINLLLASGYKCHYDEENESFEVWRNKDYVASLSAEEVDDRIAANGRNKDNHKDVIRNLRGILLDRRRRSMKMKVTEQPDTRNTKSKHVHTVTDKLGDMKRTRFNGEKGLDISGERKAQFKQFLLDIKKELGISVVFSQWKDGCTKGYTLIDNKDKIVFKGSDVVNLHKLLNPDWRKGQQKDGIITADDAAAIVEEIQQDDNLPQSIERQLERMGIDVFYSKEVSYAMFNRTTEVENRHMAITLMRQVMTMIESEEDATEEGRQQIKDIAKEAVCRAVCANVQRELAEEEERRRKTAEEARRTEQVKAQQRAEQAKAMTWNMVARYVVDTLDDYDITHAPGGHEFDDHNVSTMKEDTCISAAMSFLEQAICATNNGEKKKYANLAIGYARAAERRHQMDVNQTQEREAEQRQQEKLRQEQDRTVVRLPFVDIKVTVISNATGVPSIKAVIDGKDFEARMLSREHSALYAHAPDKEQMALFLAMHYFSDEIKEAQEENWKEKHFEAGKVPYGVTLSEISYYGDNQGIRWWVRSRVDVPGRDSEYETAEVSREEIIRIANAEGKKKDWLFDRLASEHIGRKIVENASYPSFEALKENLFGGELAEQNCLEGLQQTVQTFSAFASELCNGFMDSCGEFAVAYFNAMLGGEGYVPSVGGGPSNNDLPRKKDDDDDKHRIGIMGLNLAHKSSGAKHKR